MTDTLAVAQAVTLTVADGMITTLGKRIAEQDTRLLIRALADAADTLHRYGLLP